MTPPALSPLAPRRHRSGYPNSRGRRCKWSWLAVRMAHGRLRPPCKACAATATSTDGTSLSLTAAARPRKVGHETCSSWSSAEGGWGSVPLASSDASALASAGASALASELGGLGSAHMMGTQSLWGPGRGWEGEQGRGKERDGYKGAWPEGVPLGAIPVCRRHPVRATGSAGGNSLVASVCSSPWGGAGSGHERGDHIALQGPPFDKGRHDPTSIKCAARASTPSHVLGPDQDPQSP